MNYVLANFLRLFVHIKLLMLELYFRIRDVRTDNAGRYICTATNSAGRTRDYVILNVKGMFFIMLFLPKFNVH